MLKRKAAENVAAAAAPVAAPAPALAAPTKPLPPLPTGVAPRRAKPLPPSSAGGSSSARGTRRRLGQASMDQGAAGGLTSSVYLVVRVATGSPSTSAPPTSRSSTSSAAGKACSASPSARSGPTSKPPSPTCPPKPPPRWERPPPGPRCASQLSDTSAQGPPRRGHPMPGR